jgi:C1A family cysteine protease
MERGRIYNLIIERGMCPEKVKIYSLTKLTTLPPMVDLRSKLTVMYDQGQLGSCTANALCYCYVFNDTKCNPSRLFVYYNERMLDKSINDDAGSTLTQGINALEKYGACSETLWPYVIERFKIKPSTTSYTDGLKHTVLTASRVQQTITNIKTCLANGFPFVVGILIYQSFESDIVEKTGMVPMPNTKTEMLLGGHAVTCVGYNDAKGVWIMKNSWGSGWGDKGHFYLPYAYLLSTTLSGDMWQITKVKVLTTAQKIMVYNKLEATKYMKK